MSQDQFNLTDDQQRIVAGLTELCEPIVNDEWDNGADYNLDAIVGHVVTDGNSLYANQVRPPALPSHARSLSTPSLLSVGRARCVRGSSSTAASCVWEDFPPDVVWYEIEANVNGTIAYEQYMEQLANDESEAAAAAEEEAELEELEDDEDLPPP